MLTTSHAIYNLAILGKKSQAHLNPWILLGAVIPDFGVVVFYFLHYGQENIWDTVYFQDPWPDRMGLTHSLWLWPLLALVSYLALVLLRKLKLRVDSKNQSRTIQNLNFTTFFVVLTSLFVSMTLHSIFDLPVHAEDAYRIFSPFSKWTFESPISYWDSNYGAVWVSLLDLILTPYLYFCFVRQRIQSRTTQRIFLALAVFSTCINLFGIGLNLQGLTLFTDF